MTATVTFCIPAYRSEAFIHHTLRSVLAQSHADFVVDIGIEPPADGLLETCGDLLQDSRIVTRVNPSVLGWAENIKGLLQRVSTPYFVILSHDDLITNDYIESLLAVLQKRPNASVAYADMACFGDDAFNWSMQLLEQPLFDRLISFFLQGTEAIPVRGLTRSSVLHESDFPTDPYDGFAAECEWVMHLLLRGSAIRVARPLYMKRLFADSEISASRRRLAGRSVEQLFRGLEHHRERILKFIRQANLPDDCKDIVALAAEAAMLRRHMTFSMGALNRVQLDRSDYITTAVAGSKSRYAKSIQAMNLLTLSQHAFLEGDKTAAMNLATLAVEADPEQWEGLAQLSKLQLDSNCHAEALDSALRAWTVAPDGRGLREMIAACVLSVEDRELQGMLKDGNVDLLGKHFDAAAYLVDHPDVAQAGMDPWQHYRDFGRAERRKVRMLK